MIEIRAKSKLIRKEKHNNGRETSSKYDNFFLDELDCSIILESYEKRRIVSCIDENGFSRSFNSRAKILSWGNSIVKNEMFLDIQVKELRKAFICGELEGSNGFYCKIIF